MAARKTKKSTNPNDIHLELVVNRLRAAVDAIHAAAIYFEALGLKTQTQRLDSAIDSVEDVQEVAEVLLGRVELEGFEPPAKAA